MRPTRKNTLGQTPKLSHAPCDKPLSSQASLRVLFPESILGVFLLFVVVVMYKRIGMSNESILHTTSAALLPLLFKPFAISMAGRLHISHTATRLGFFLAFVFLLTMAHGIKNAASNIQYFSLFSLAISFCLISNTRPLCTVNAPAAATDAPWRKCAISYEIAILALMGGLVMFAGVLHSTTQNIMGRIVRRHGHFPAFSFPVPSLQHHTPRERRGMQQVLISLRRTFFCAYGRQTETPMAHDMHHRMFSTPLLLASSSPSFPLRP